MQNPYCGAQMITMAPFLLNIDGIEIYINFQNGNSEYHRQIALLKLTTFKIEYIQRPTKFAKNTSLLKTHMLMHTIFIQSK